MVRGTISVGDRLELQKLKNREDELNDSKVYLSQLIDFVDNDKANIAMPIVKGRIIPLDIGDRYIICFYTVKGLFQCKAIITARFKHNNIYALEVQFLSELEKYQRRQYYRLECHIDINYHAITEAEILLDKQIKRDMFESEKMKNECVDLLESYRTDWKKGTITDISGGGLRFISKEMYEVGNDILLNLELRTKEGNKSLSLQVNVISSIKMINHHGYYENRAQFLDIQKEERETIIKFIFEEDRRLRKKEKGLD